MNPKPTLAARVAALEARFAMIAATRMAGVPLLNERLAVAAVGFEPVEGDEGGAVGVLLTPWFMNLLWLPGEEAQAAAPGASRRRAVGRENFEFIGALEECIGPYEACSLFSPMFEFEDQAAALATAREVLAQLRRPPEPPPQASRRALLFGRTASQAR